MLSSYFSLDKNGVYVKCINAGCLMRDNVDDLDLYLVLIGRQIRKERELRGYSQEKFAEITGFHRTYIGSVERGKQNLTLESYSRIADGLGLSLCELVLKTMPLSPVKK